MKLTEARLAQRRANVVMIAAQRRAAEFCQRGHKDWVWWGTQERRQCRTCNKDNQFYRRHGIQRPD